MNSLPDIKGEISIQRLEQKIIVDMRTFKFIQFQKDRVYKKEITAATVRNYVKSIKLFSEMADIPIPWKKITRGLPKGRKYAGDRIPTIEEIRKVIEYPDRRIKAIVYTMASSGIRIGAWDYLQWGHVRPLNKDGDVFAAKLIVYAGHSHDDTRKIYN
jgi:integrase